MSTPLIALSGPHAVGKTTAVYRWLGRYPGLIGIIADNQWEAFTNEAGELERVRVVNWKGTTEEKGACVNELRGRGRVAVIDSVRTTCINHFGPQDHVIFVTCSGATMGRVLRARCAANGKKFAEAYWDARKLEYEGRTRYVNCAAKWLRPGQWREFTIEDQERDWPAVDEYFGTLYRKVHNEIVRRRRTGVTT